MLAKEQHEISITHVQPLYLLLNAAVSGDPACCPVVSEESPCSGSSNRWRKAEVLHQLQLPQQRLLLRHPRPLGPPKVGARLDQVLRDVLLVRLHFAHTAEKEGTQDHKL